MPPKHGMMACTQILNWTKKVMPGECQERKKTFNQGEHLILVVGFHVAIQASTGYERSKNE